jgi:Zn-dependent peptidase ImmA (M78 family)/DNA-binding XRE family transcriptional regulator
MDYARLGKRLRLAREQAGLDQSEAAGLVGVTPAALNQYEMGKRRLEALMLERLARLYGRPVSFFFEQEAPPADWEAALRAMARTLSAAGKAGVSHLIEEVGRLEDLHAITGTPTPGLPHAPFPPLSDTVLADYEVAEYAEKTRRHYDLGMAPLIDLRGFLEALGYRIFATPLGGGEDDLAGLFFRHPDLGPIVAMNADQAYTRRPFTLAHEFAHGLFHYDRPAILCRSRDHSPLEVFADRFAAAFLVPEEALHERLRDLGVKTVARPAEVVHLARYFGVSYQAMRRRLLAGRRLAADQAAFEGVQPALLARTLGYHPSALELGQRPLPPEERLPRLFIQLASEAVDRGEVSLAWAAEALGISELELEERLAPTPVEAPEELYA